MAAPVSVPLLAHFAALSDPRQRAKVLYPLPEILLLVLAATIAGADDFVETTLWGTEHLAFLRRFYRYDSGIPSHDTLCDVFAALDPELFKSCFLAWINGLRDHDPGVFINTSPACWDSTRRSPAWRPSPPRSTTGTPPISPHCAAPAWSRPRKPRKDVTGRKPASRHSPAATRSAHASCARTSSPTPRSSSCSSPAITNQGCGRHAETLAGARRCWRALDA